MAINMQDKKGLFKQIVSEADFNISSAGITVISPRLSTPRFIPFDDAGKCRCCKATEVELDSMVTKEGITIWCTRMKAVQFVPFDHVHDLPGHCFFKIKNKARVFNIPYGDVAPITCPVPPPPPPMPTTTKVDQHTQTKADLIRQLLESNLLADVLAKTKTAVNDPGLMSEEVKRKAKLALQLLSTNLVADALERGSSVPKQEIADKAKEALKVLGNFLLADALNGKGDQKQQPTEQAMDVDKAEEEKELVDFYNKISAATAFMDTSVPPPPGEIPLPKEQQQQQPTETTDDDEKLLLEFYDSISAATTYLDYAQQQQQTVVKPEETLLSPPLATPPQPPREEEMKE